MNLYEAVLVSQGGRKSASVSQKNSQNAAILNSELGRTRFEEVTPASLQKSNISVTNGSAFNKSSKGIRAAGRKNKW